VINIRPIARVIAVLLFLIGGLMWTGLPVSWVFKSGDALPLFYSGLISIVTGVLLWFAPFPGNNAIKKREGYLIVAVGWLVMAVFGMLPYILSGVIPQISSALFEAISGTTTTGASVLTDIEVVPKGILYWRSLTQWIGGMGIVVLTVAIFPILGIGGIELFVAEAPGPTSDKIHPRIQETAKRLWLVYVALTGMLAILLTLAGMSWYEAINHAFTTMATGGFSTRNDSIAAFAHLPLIQYIIIAFMFLAGTNFTLIYFGLKGKFNKVWKSDEFRAYLFLLALLTIVVTLVVKTKTGLGWENSFRDSLFQIVSVITTTGFVSADYTAWGSSMTMLFFIMLFLGASAGSTSGGIKLIRHLVFFKNSILEFKRILHPRALVPLKLNGQVVTGRILMHIIIFLLLYLILFVIGVIGASIMGLDFMTAVGAVATSLGNVGPGIGNVGPVDNFAWLPEHLKIFLAFLMLLGRLEIFTILVLFTPYFWKSN
jgi:trk system potassium uptake protein